MDRFRTLATNLAARLDRTWVRRGQNPYAGYIALSTNRDPDNAPVLARDGIQWRVNDVWLGVRYFKKEARLFVGLITVDAESFEAVAAQAKTSELRSGIFRRYPVTLERDERQGRWLRLGCVLPIDHERELAEEGVAKRAAELLDQLEAVCEPAFGTAAELGACDDSDDRPAGHDDIVRSVAFSPDGRRLASGSNDRTVRLWDAATGAAIRVLEGHEDCVNTIAFSPDGRWLASGSDDNTGRLWDAATGAAIRVLERHEDRVNTVAFSPDGRWLASGSDDKTVRLWDAATGAEVRVLEGHEGWVMSVAFSPDGRWLASGSHDMTVRLWDAATGAEVRVLEGHEGPVTSVAFSPDGRWLASGSWDRTVRPWDAATGAAVQMLKGHERWVTSVVFSPDGRWLASGSADHTARVWDTDSAEQLLCLGAPVEPSEDTDDESDADSDDAEDDGDVEQDNE